MAFPPFGEPVYRRLKNFFNMSAAASRELADWAWYVWGGGATLVGCGDDETLLVTQAFWRQTRRG